MPLPTPQRAASGSSSALLVLVLVLALVCAFPWFAAAQSTGAISGTVTNAATGQPIQAIRVIAFQTGSGFFTTSVLTNASGAYTLTGLPAGSYAVNTFNSAGYIDEVFDNLTCRGVCDTSLATPVAVGTGTTSGIDFALERGGTISGTVRNASTGAPVANVFVRPFEASDRFRPAAVPTNSSGFYSITGLVPGSYLLATQNTAGFVDEIIGNVQCVGICDDADVFARGVPITVGQAQLITGQDFSLDVGGTVTGKVTDAATGSPLANVALLAYERRNGQPRQVAFAQTSATGDYTIGGLTTVDLFVFTSASGYINEAFDNVACPGFCRPEQATSGTPIPVTLGNTVAGRNITLDRGGSVTGRVVDAVTQAPIAGVEVVPITRQNGTVVRMSGATTNASGVYTLTGVPLGSIEVFTGGNHGYANQIYGGPDCIGACRDVVRASAGTRLNVTAAGVTGIDFSLRRGGRISGVVTDAVSNSPLANVEVEVLAIVGGTLSPLDSVRTDAAGAYTSQVGLATGAYLVVAFDNQGHVPQVYNGVNCVGGDECLELALGGTVSLIPVTAGVTAANKNFTLLPGGSVTGTVTEVGGSAAARLDVSLYKRAASGLKLVQRTSVGTSGQYVVRGLMTGTYVAFTTSRTNLANEIYNDVACDGACTPAAAGTSGTPIAVTTGAPTTGINFVLRPRTEPGAPTNLRASVTAFNAAFTWDPPSSVVGGAATSYILEAGLSPGTTIATAPVAGTSFVAPGVPPGRYYVRIRGVNGAGTGPPSTELVLDVLPGGSAPLLPPQNVSAFVTGSRLTLTWTPPAGQAPTGYIVEAGTAAGLSNIGTLPVSTTSFWYEPVPNGVYFLRVRSRDGLTISTPSAEVMVVVGAVASPPDPPLNLQYTAVGPTLTFQWLAPAAGTPTSYVLEVGSATGLSNLAVFATGSPATSITFNGVPPGRYYVRLRATNAAGTGTPSNEIVVDVSATVPLPTPIARWKLDGNAADDLGVWNGTPVALTAATDRKGTAGGAVSFDGVSSYIDIGPLHPPNTRFSIAFWMKPAVSTTTTGYLLENEIVGDAGGNVGFRVFQQASSLYFQTQGGTGGTVFTAMQPADTQRWVHVVGVYDGQARLYVDGALVAQSAVGTSFGTGFQRLQIGRDVNLATSYWKGLLDDMQLFDRALTVPEITALFQQ